jgi:hypothetical protein
VKKLDALSQKQQKTRLSRVLNCIQKFNERIEPYFQVVGIFVQSNPEYAAIFWGSLRLLLQVYIPITLTQEKQLADFIYAQLVDNFSGFFDKLLHILLEISAAIPQYDDIANLFHSSISERMGRHLEGVYENLFSFFQIVAGVFTKSDGSM